MVPQETGRFAHRTTASQPEEKCKLFRMDSVLVRSRARPIQILFLVPHDDEKLIRRVLLYNCAVWGGFQNFVIPVKRGRIERPWSDLLTSIEPDQVYFFSDVSAEIQDYFAFKAAPASSRTLDPSVALEFLHPGSYGEASPLTAMPVLSQLAWSGNPDGEIICPHADPNSGLYDLTLVNLGLYDTDLHGFLEKSSLRMRHVEITSPEQILSLLISERPRAFLYLPFGVTSYMARPFHWSHSGWFRRNCPELYLSRSWNDALFVWNMRALVSPELLDGFLPIWFPFRFLPQAIDRLAELIATAKDRKLRFDSLSSTGSVKKAKALAEGRIQLAEKPFREERYFQLPKAVDLTPRFPWSSTNLISVSQGKSVIGLPPPVFQEDIGRFIGTYITEFRVTTVDDERNLTSLPRCTELAEHFVKTHGGKALSARITRAGQLAVKVNSDERTIVLEIPLDEVLFRHVLGTNSQRHTAPRLLLKGLSDKGKYAKGTVELFGSLVAAASVLQIRQWREAMAEMASPRTAPNDRLVSRARKTLARHGVAPKEQDAVLRHFADKVPTEVSENSVPIEYIHPLLDHYLEDFSLGPQLGRDDLNFLKKNLLKWANIDRSSFAVKTLIERNIIRPGFDLKCANCGMISWTHLNSTSLNNPCPGCGHSNVIEVESIWKYRLNHLVAQAVNQHGCVPLILALHRTTFHLESPRFLFSFDLTINGENGKEVDALIMDKAGIEILDVKVSERRFTKAGLRNAFSLAKDVHADRVVLSSMDPLFCDSTLRSISMASKDSGVRAIVLPLESEYITSIHGRYYHHGNCPRVKDISGRQRIRLSPSEAHDSKKMRCPHCKENSFDVEVESTKIEVMNYWTRQ